MAQSSPGAKRDMPWSLVVFGLLAVYALLLVVLNDDKVKVDFVFFSAQISLLVLILLCLGMGFAAGFVFDRWRDRRRRAASAQASAD